LQQAINTDDVHPLADIVVVDEELYSIFEKKQNMNAQFSRLLTRVLIGVQDYI
jgi:hypothetical protein